ARKHGLHRWVTVAIDQVDFVAPVLVGDVVAFHTRTLGTGRTSVKVEVQVEAERFITGDTVKVTQAALPMVSIDADGRPIPFKSPPRVHRAALAHHGPAALPDGPSSSSRRSGRSPPGRARARRS